MYLNLIFTSSLFTIEVVKPQNMRGRKFWNQKSLQQYHILGFSDTWRKINKYTKIVDNLLVRIEQDVMGHR